MIEHIKIQNYKSIRELDLPLTALNVLIGSNGAGKSNFISFFELVKAIYEQRLAGYTMQKGGFERFLHNGLKGNEYDRRANLRHCSLSTIKALNRIGMKRCVNKQIILSRPTLIQRI